MLHVSERHLKVNQVRLVHAFIMVGTEQHSGKKTWPSQSVQTRHNNVVRKHLPGTIRAAINVLSPLESYDLFFNHQLIDLVLDSLAAQELFLIRLSVTNCNCNSVDMLCSKQTNTSEL